MFIFMTLCHACRQHVSACDIKLARGKILRLLIALRLIIFINYIKFIYLSISYTCAMYIEMIVRAYTLSTIACFTQG